MVDMVMNLFDPISMFASSTATTYQSDVHPLVMTAIGLCLDSRGTLRSYVLQTALRAQQKAVLHMDIWERGSEHQEVTSSNLKLVRISG